MPNTFPFHLLGFTVSGDIGSQTVYTDRFGKKVFYPKAPPDKPGSDLQVSSRTRFKEAQAEYMSLTQTEKDDWENLIRRSNLCMTGQNLFIHTALIHDFESLQTVMNQTRQPVTPPTPV